MSGNGRSDNSGAALPRIDRAIRLVWRCAPRWTSLNIVIILFLGLLPLASVYLTKLIVDSVTVGMTESDKSGAFMSALLFVCLAGLVIFLKSLFTTVSSVVSTILGELVTIRIHTMIHVKAVSVELGRYEDSDYCDLLHRAQQEAGHRPINIVDELTQMALHTITFISMAGVLFSLSWVLPALVFAAGVPGLFVRAKAANRLYHWRLGKTFQERLAWLFHWIMTDRTFAKEIRAYQTGDFFSRRFLSLRRDILNQRQGLLFSRAKGEILCDLLGVVVFFASYVVIVYWTIMGGITLGAMVMLYQALQTGQTSFNDIMKALARLYQHHLFLQGLYQFLDLEHEDKKEHESMEFPEEMAEGLALDNVSFRYPGNKADTVSNIDLIAQPGQIVALVGPNGSGKSTIIKLISRFYVPDSGVISIDGIDINRIRATAFRKNLGVIAQDFQQYPLSAQENIHLGRIDQSVDEHRVVSAAIYATANDFLSKLVNGYQTILGRWVQGAAELSNGQWQRVALARLLYRDASILLLDEPTSSMDEEAEREFFNNLRNMVHGKVILMVTHRASALKYADRIYRLADKGLVLEK